MTRKDKMLLKAQGDVAPVEKQPYQAVPKPAQTVIEIAQRIALEIKGGSIPADSFNSVFHQAVDQTFRR